MMIAKSVYTNFLSTLRILKSDDLQEIATNRILVIHKAREYRRSSCWKQCHFLHPLHSTWCIWCTWASCDIFAISSMEHSSNHRIIISTSIMEGCRWRIGSNWALTWKILALLFHGEDILEISPNTSNVSRQTNSKTFCYTGFFLYPTTELMPTRTVPYND